MACAGCSANVERKLKAMDGIKSVSVSLPGRTAMVEYDERVVTPADMKRVIDGAGYLLIIDDDTRVDALERNAYRHLKRRMILSWLLALLTMSVSMGWVSVGSNDAANQVLLIIGVLRTPVLRQCLASVRISFGQYGHACGAVYPHLVRLQRI